MISPVMISALLAALLASVCLSAFADSTQKPSTISTEGSAAATPSSFSSAPAVNKDDAIRAEKNNVESVSRTSAHSMHPKAHAVPAVADEVQAPELLED